MPYNPKDFGDVVPQASMAPSELQPPLNYADGGAVGWAGDTTVYNTQSQIGNILATPGGFSGMSHQFTAPSPMAMAEGGSVNNLSTRLAQEFSKRGLDMNKMIAQRKAYAYGGDVRGGDNPGGLSGDTGAYSGRSSGGSEAGFSARAGDTPGFGSGGDRSVGGGGGYGSTSSGISGGGDRGGYDRGDGGRSEPAPAPSPATARAAENASMEALQNVMATSPAALMPASLRDIYSQANYQSDVLNRQRAEQNAAQASYDTQRQMALEGLKNLPDPILSISPVVAAKQAADKAAMTYRGINPNEAYGSQSVEFETQPSPLDAYSQVVADQRPIDPFYSQLQSVNDQLAKLRQEGQQIEKAQAAGRAVNPNVAYGGEPQEFEGQPSPLEAYSRVKTVPTSPFESLVKSMTNLASMSDAAKGSILDAARKANAPSVFTQPSPTENIYTYTPPVKKVQEQPAVKEETVEPAAQENFVATAALPAAKKAVTAPVTTPAVKTQAATTPADKGILSQIMSGFTGANANRIAELEKQNQFAGGNKQQVAAALNVDPSQLQSRIVNYDGQQKVDYFTKGLDQVLGDIISGPFKAIENLFGGGNYDLKNGYSITPSGDVIPTPVYKAPAESGGGGGGANAMAQPVTTPLVAAAQTPVATAPVVPPTTFKRKYIPLTNYATYGYGPESALYEYTAAKGGAVGPLSQKRK